MKSRKLLLFCLLVLMIQFHQVLATTCPDTDVTAQLDSTIALTDLQPDTDLPARIAEIRGALVTLKQYCYPDTVTIVATPTIPDVPEDNASEDDVKIARPSTQIFGYAEATLTGTQEKINQCLELRILQETDTATQVEYRGSFLDPANSVTAWVYTELFPSAFDGMQLLGNQVNPRARIFADLGADAAEISVQLQANTTYTLSQPSLQTTPKSTRFPAGLVSRLQVQLSDSRTGWVSPGFLASALLGRTIATTYDPTTAVRSDPNLNDSEKVIARVPPGTLLRVFEVSEDGLWLHIEKRTRSWVAPSDITPRVFAPNQSVQLIASLNFRKEPTETSVTLINQQIPSSTQIYEVKKVSEDGLWVQITYQGQDGWVNTCGLA